MVTTSPPPLPTNSKCKRSFKHIPLILLLLIPVTTASRTLNNLWFRAGATVATASATTPPEKNEEEPTTQKAETSTPVVLTPPPEKSKEESTTTTTTTTPPVTLPKMPCLFNLPEELPYDRYAACLAATEGLRRARETEISSSAPPKRWAPFGEKKKVKSEEQKRADAKYIINSGKVIKALGLTVPQFNQLGREVMKDSLLKERVMEQAYLYRMTAALAMPRTPLLTSDETLLKSQRKHRIQMFAKATMEIEDLRKAQLDRLCRALKVDHLPEGLQLSDPRVLAILNPKVRAVCEAFPLQAEEIVRKYGMNSEEFNGMLDGVKTDALMRWKVNSHIKKAGKKGRT